MHSLISDDVIISLRRVYADGLLSGTKCVELRRRAPALKNGTRVWLYAKVPTGQVIGVGILGEVATGTPDELWSQFHDCAGLTQKEFYEYFKGVEKGAALKFESVSPLISPIALDELKRLELNFQPPQFFRRVKSQALRSQLKNSKTGPASNPCAH